MKRIILIGITLLFAFEIQAQNVQPGKQIIVLNKEILDTVSLNKYFDVLADNDKFMGDVAISKNNQIVYQKSFGFSNIAAGTKANASTTYTIGSVSKTFTSVLILKAIEDKKIDFNTPLKKFFPQIVNADKITIRNLLNHSSGIFSITDDADYLMWYTLVMSESDFLKKIAARESQFEPNSKNEYSNSNYILLSYILEKIYQRSYGEILDQHIVKPLRLKHTYFGNVKKDNEAFSYIYNDKWIIENETHYSVPLGAGAIVSNATDLVYFMNALLSYKIINQHSVTTMTQYSDRYGLGLFDLPFEDHQGFGHDGAIDGFKSIMTIFPEEKLTYAIVSNASNYKLDLVTNTLLNVLFHNKLTIPEFKNISFTDEELNVFVGVFSAAALPFKITIVKEDRSLTAQATGQSAFVLDAVEKNSFSFDKAGIKLTFSNDGATMMLHQAGREIELKKEQ